MCGIAGIFYFDGTRVGPDLIQTMCQKLVHRGPDDSGIYIESNIGLGHRRLSIIDLSSKARQPMFNENETVILVFNGEIYNFVELRDSLIRLGHRFQSKTDSEVIIHLYEDYGVGCLEYLEGMFAFVIWDKKKRQLFLARDRLGKKPLYYSLSKNRIVFASEINALKTISDIDFSIDFEALDLYLEYQFIPSPWTIYKGIRKVHPAHYILVDPKKFSTKQYWDVNYCKKLNISFPQAVEEAEEKIQQAVKKRMISDVPLGALLSGGVDSSIVVYFMSKLSNGSVRTFSAGFKEESFNELPYAQKVSQTCKTQHYELIVTSNIQNDLPKIVSQYGEPFADKSMVPSYYICQEARQHVTVALTGDGGDELCLGYDKYKLRRAIKTYMKLPVKLRMKFLGSVGFLLNKSSLKQKIIRSVMPEYKVLSWDDFWWEHFKLKLYNEEFRKNLNSGFGQERIGNFISKMDISACESEEKLLWADIHNYLPDDLLVKMDVASMAHSLEVRSPFLDHKVIEFFAQIPLKYKLYKGESKYILKKIAEKYLPAEVIYRKKMGFGMPVSQWVKEDFLGLLHNYVVENMALWDLFSKDYFFKVLYQHKKGLANHGQRIWAMLVLGIWLKESFKSNKR